MDIRSGAEGRVLEKFVQTEVEVKKGDPLLRLDETRARLALETELARHTVRSPISGVVTSLNVEAGKALGENQILGVVSDVEKLRVFLHVPQDDLPLFPLGKKIPLLLSPKRHETLRPEVMFVSPSADPKTGLFKIEAILNNKNHAVPAKVQGNVEIETEVFPEGPIVPAGAVRFSGNETTLVREEKGKPMPVPVRLGPEINGFYPVLEGLSAGERVFVGQ